MVVCAVPGCCSTKDENPHNYTFHTFPQNNVVRQKWIKMLCLDDWTPRKYSKICSKHFEKKYFFQGALRIKLRNSAVPTLYMPISNHNYIKSETEIPIKLESDINPASEMPDSYNACSQSTEEMIQGSSNNIDIASKCEEEGKDVRPVENTYNVTAESYSEKQNVKNVNSYSILRQTLEAKSSTDIKINPEDTDNENSESSDGFEAFGRYVSNKLESLKSTKAQHTVERLISTILYDASIGKYD